MTTTVTVQGNPSSGVYTFTLPPNAGPSGGILNTDGAGNLGFVAISGDATLSGSGALTVTKTGGAALAPSATTDTTNASNISSGTLNALRLPSIPATLLPIGLLDSFCCLDANFTLTSTTAAQKLFNATTLGTVNLPTGLYFFEGLLYITAMSATSGNAEILFTAGTAVIDSMLWTLWGVDDSAPTTVNEVAFSFVLNSGNVSPASGTLAETGTAWAIRLSGVLRLSTGGTLVPQIALVNAATAVVNKNSFIRFTPTSTTMAAATLGTWT